MNTINSSLINEQYLCVLKEESGEIAVGIVPIELKLSTVFSQLNAICENEATSLEDIINFLESQTEIEQLDGYYPYCRQLYNSYEGFRADRTEIISNLNQTIDRIRLEKRSDPSFNSADDIKDKKMWVKREYTLWRHAHAIKLAYRVSNDDPKVLSFSHRICGWSNPVYHLTPNFSIEIKTNFGYGSVSYFYTKLRYKNIDITPLSEWIHYEFAKFSEIVRYSQRYLLNHTEWLQTMAYAKDACNLSRSDEAAFVSKYIITECETMVSGLREVMNKDRFDFRNESRRNYQVDKRGHVLVEFRGEKVSGALDFIDKIMEFGHITAVQSFIERIKVCNRELQPLLASEIILLNTKIATALKAIEDYRPTHNEYELQEKEFVGKKDQIRKDLIRQNRMTEQHINYDLLNSTFDESFPEFKEFKEDYGKVMSNWSKLHEHHRNLVNICDKISAHNRKILDFFNN